MVLLNEFDCHDTEFGRGVGAYIQNLYCSCTCKSSRWFASIISNPLLMVLRLKYFVMPNFALMERECLMRGMEAKRVARVPL